MITVMDNNDTEEQPRDGAVEIILEELAEAEADASAAKEKASSLRQALSDRLRISQIKRYNHQAGDQQLRATLVRTQPIIVDFDKMVRDGVLTDEELKLVTKSDFSKALLEEAVDSGAIKAGKVMPYISTDKERYSVRFTRAARDSSE